MLSRISLPLNPGYGLAAPDRDAAGPTAGGI